MSAEFLDTNVLLYAHDAGAGAKQGRSIELVAHLGANRSGAVSVQVLAEFYSAATKKLRMRSEEAEEILSDFGFWNIHRPGHSDLMKAAQLHRRYKLSWWDALIVNSALELGCSVLWTEDLNHGQRFGSLIVRNPF
ncbi:MAG: PIN domain-containing protein [Bryobacteraceae bacterium]